jgi:tetratricopeptide (TPR) repeat protein
LAAVSAARERERELIALCDDSFPPEPGLWTIRDHLAHLTEWRRYATRTLDAARTGSKAPNLGDDIDVINAHFYEANKDKTSDEVKSEVQASYDELLAAISTHGDADLEGPRPDEPKSRLWQVVPGNSYGHLAQHLMFWHLEQGDEEGAEAAQQWIYDLVRSQFPEPQALAAATYNLACFYIRVGRDDEALARLEHAFELDASLKKLAPTDPDLDRIRDHPDLVAMLGRQARPS